MEEKKLEKVEKKEEAPVKENESAKVETNKGPEAELVTNIFKSFDIQPKTTSYGTSYVLKLTSYGDYEFEIRLSETQKLLVDEVGKENCKVCVENRYSQEKRKQYVVVAFYVGDEVFDLFPRDRTSISLCRMHHKKYAK